ncbi:MAG TPA: hypothetical protein VNX68_01475, partial [Nitrosopumilaceae archaeon]|nr:hypothetical protein [Nitrosopumilaceae archaeon]
MKKIINSVFFALMVINASAQHQCALGKMNKVIGHPVISSTYTDLENKYDVHFQHLNVNLEITDKNISGNTRTISTVLTSTLDTFAFELYNSLVIDSVILNGKKITPVRVQNIVNVLISPVLNSGNTIDATVYYHGTPPTINGPNVGDGLNNASSQTWGNQVTWTLSEPYSAYEWFPSKQQLQDKLDSVYVFVTTDSANKAGSNGNLTRIVNLGNKKRFEWKEKHPIDYYLVSVTVAQFVDYSIYAHPVGYPDSVLIQNYIYNNPATLTNYKPTIDQTKTLVELFSGLYGMYPFADEKYGHCMAPFGGGMEHQTMTSLGSFSM